MSVIDFHTHILPDIDDGSESVETSVQMLKKQAEQGVQTVVATPHFYANYQSPESFLEKRRKSEQKLREAVKDINGIAEFVVGTEVYYFEGISDCSYLKDMAIAGTESVMVEMPMKKWSERNLKEIAGIYQKQGLTPIMAHVDRYVTPFNAIKIFEQLSQLPVLIQVNASFFVRRRTRRLAMRLLKHGRIHLIGTDCHNLDTRPPEVERAIKIIERACGRGGIEKINYFEQKVLNGL